MESWTDILNDESELCLISIPFTHNNESGWVELSLVIIEGVLLVKVNLFPTVIFLPINKFSDVPILALDVIVPLEVILPNMSKLPVNIWVSSLESPNSVDAEVMITDEDNKGK